MEQKQITTAQQIKDILAPIPSEMFLLYYLYDGDDPTKSDVKKCALGHIHFAICGDAGGNGIDFGAYYLTRKYLKTKKNKVSSIARVNNGNEEILDLYPEDNPKDRVMHLLEDMIKDGY